MVSQNKRKKCKHEWLPVKVNPFCPISTNDSWGLVAQFVCVCLKCNTFKTIVAERIEKQANALEWCNEGFDAPEYSKEELGDEIIGREEDE